MFILIVTTDSHGLIVNTNVLVSGHPAALVLVEVYVPLDVYVVLFSDHVYVPHVGEVTVSTLDVLLLIVNTNVFVRVHPAAFRPVEVYVPLAV
jgi:hypothetical protein